MADPVADPVAAWQREHEHFARLLELLQQQLDVFHRAGEPDYPLMQEIVDCLRVYGDRCHHPREDAAFARLARYCPEIELVLARLQQEHRVIAYWGDRLLAQFASALQGAIVARDDIEAIAATYLAYYRGHLRIEEEIVLPRAADRLTDADWLAVVAAAPTAGELLAGPDAERFRLLRREFAGPQAA